MPLALRHAFLEFSLDGRGLQRAYGCPGRAAPDGWFDSTILNGYDGIMAKKRRARPGRNGDGRAMGEWLRAAAYDAIADKFYEEMSRFWDDPVLSVALREFAARAHVRMLEILKEIEGERK